MKWGATIHIHEIEMGIHHSLNYSQRYVHDETQL